MPVPQPDGQESLGPVRLLLVGEPLRFVRARAMILAADFCLVLVGLLVAVAPWVSLSALFNGTGQDPEPSAATAAATRWLVGCLVATAVLLFVLLIVSWHRWARRRLLVRDAAGSGWLRRLLSIAAALVIATAGLTILVLAAMSPILVPLIAQRPVGVASVAGALLGTVLAGAVFARCAYPLVFLPFSAVAGTGVLRAFGILRRPDAGTTGLRVTGYLLASVLLASTVLMLFSVLWFVILVGHIIWLALLVFACGYLVAVAGGLWVRLAPVADDR